MVKNCDLGLENAALGLRPRAVFSRPRSQFFTIRTSQPANNIYIFIQIVEAIFKIFELKHFQRAHHINIYIITIITVIIIEFQKLKYFLNLNFSNTFQFSSNAFSPNQRLVPE